ncbi:MAG: AraC family transcriptional regulator, partial [Candidatus Eremiobacteraeota bacterium]|nr:AraC family transcriptional regulator [Candidatus Eremiobacteraeota bacterium]
MPSRELNELSSALQSHIQSDGLLETAVRELKLFRASTPTEEETVVYDPCLCVVVQGAKEIVVGQKTYHYNPSQSLLVSVDMPATTRVAEASQESPCVALVVRLQSNVVADLLAEGTVVGSPGPPGNGVGVTPA